MSAQIVALADAVVAALNTASFSMPFVAMRSYQPIYTLADTRTLRVAVVPRSIVHEFASREQMRVHYTIDIGIMYKPAQLTLAAIDELMLLTQEIMRYFRGKRVPLLAMRCMRAVNEPIYAAEHLDEFRQYTSLITLTYRHDEVI